MSCAAEQLREPFLLALPLMCRSSAQAAIGNVDAASRDADRLETAIQTLGDADLSAWVPGLRVSIAVQTGRFDDYADLCVFAAEAFPEVGVWAAAAAATLATAGRTAEALEWLDRLAARDFDAHCRGGFYTGLLATAGICVGLLETRHRPRVLELLEDILDVPLCTAGPVNINSPLHYAGVIRRVMGDLDGAIDRLRQAAAGLETIGARGYLAQTRAQLAAVLAERNHPGDLDEAHRISAAAINAAQELGIGDVENVCGDFIIR
jgi:tetratricopeptide (TPR) repeat protein